MNKDSTQNAINEARRFISAAQKAIKAGSNDKYTWISGNKHTAAARRASMDLSRALADMRKPG